MNEHGALIQQHNSETTSLIHKHNFETQQLNAKFAAQQQCWMDEKELMAAQHEFYVKSMASQLKGVEAKEQNTHATLVWTESQLQNHKQSIHELHVEIEALKQSTSWRITAPLRKLLRKISN